ncbi:MAG: replication initiation factor domain-containing protein [Oscillospiraceae bacterium]|nr:replication initiation factor domain-containing protein [Oscillospiraceae bacterium]
MENLILFDWLSFTSPVHSVESIIDFLGLSSLTWTQCRGHRTYQDCYKFGEINICYNSSQNEGVWVEMSGQGCREFEEYSTRTFQEIFCDIVNSVDSKYYHISRIDLAYDIFDKKILDIHKLKKETENLNFVSTFKDPVIEYGVRSKSCTIYYGSRASDIYMRCYDKKVERDREDIEYWARWEIVLKNNNAKEFLTEWFTGFPIGDLFCKLINHYLRYIVPDSNQTNISRLKTARWWERFVNCIGEIRIYTPKPTAYNIYRCEDYVYRQAGNAVAALIDVRGVDRFLRDLVLNKSPTNSKYQQIRNDCGTASDNILQYLNNRGALKVNETERNIYGIHK